MTRYWLAVRSLIRPGWLLASVACVGIGVSGVIASVMSALWGAGFVSGDLPGDTYTPDRCQQLFHLAPAGTVTCAQAAAAHHLDEVISYRLAAGVTGLILLAAWRALSRRHQRRSDILPERFTDTVGASLFLSAAAILLLDSLDRLVQGTQCGAGAPLSGAMVCLALGIWYAVHFVNRAPTQPDRQTMSSTQDSTGSAFATADSARTIERPRIRGVSTGR
ncbi:MAG: hypothetical protein ACYDAC_11035 [Candidatus Dormibacteria bacterium]